jgi:hypothetical protein
VLNKENKCKYANPNAIIGLLMCTAAWINVKVLPVIAATSTSYKGKGDRKRRQRVQKVLSKPSADSFAVGRRQKAVKQQIQLILGLSRSLQLSPKYWRKQCTNKFILFLTVIT